MIQQPAISLPFWETVKRSFLYTLTNLKTVMYITGIWFTLLIYEIANGYPSVCGITEDGCTKISQHIATLVMAFASVSIAVAFCRHIILNVEYNKITFSFGRREWKYLGYKILIFLFIAVPSLALIFLAAFLAELVQVNVAPYVFVIPLVFAILSTRFYLALPAVAVNNSEVTLKVSYRLAKGNANKIFWGEVLLMLPALTIFFMASYLFVMINTDNFFVKFVYVALVMFLSFFDACLKAAYLSHIYQYFMYYKDKAGEPSVITPDKDAVPAGK